MSCTTVSMVMDEIQLLVSCFEYLKKQVLNSPEVLNYDISLNKIFGPEHGILVFIAYVHIWSDNSSTYILCQCKQQMRRLDLAFTARLKSGTSQ